MCKFIIFSGIGTVANASAIEAYSRGFETLKCRKFYSELKAQWVGGLGVLGVRSEWKPLSRREIRILAQLGLGVAPRFLQKVRAQAPKFW